VLFRELIGTKMIPATPSARNVARMCARARDPHRRWRAVTYTSGLQYSFDVADEPREERVLQVRNDDADGFARAHAPVTRNAAWLVAEKARGFVDAIPQLFADGVGVAARETVAIETPARSATCLMVDAPRRWPATSPACVRLHSSCAHPDPRRNPAAS
jgi:hypothetical protein